MRRLARDLDDLSVAVWLDEWELETGDSLHECIGTAIENSAYVGVVLSPDSVKSRWCLAELDQALAKEKRTGKKVVLPLLYRRVPLSPFLEGRFYLNFSRSYLGSLASLAACLRNIDPRAIARRFRPSRPKTVEDIALLLHTSYSLPQPCIIPEKQYGQLADFFRKLGVNVDRKGFQIRPDLLGNKHDECNVVCLDEFWITSPPEGQDSDVTQVKRHDKFEQQEDAGDNRYPLK